MVKRGGIGKHLWDVTYEEYNWYQKVNIPLIPRSWVLTNY